MHYTKPALTFVQQLQLLEDRGLTVNDPPRALRWLSKISYYRLSAYFLPFKTGQNFTPGTEFDQIAGLYIFDRKLRLLVLDAIERVEIAIRTSLTYEIGHAYGAFGHADPVNFAPTMRHVDFMAELANEEGRARETFATHFRRKYTLETHLPVWMATELLSFGTISMLYRELRPSLKQRIAGDFLVDDHFLGSWLHSLSYIRNVCAHHKRLWNRQLAVRPSIPTRNRNWPHQIPDTSRVYSCIAILRHMLKVVAPNCQWRARLFALLDAHPNVSLVAMGFPPNWRALALWR